MNAISSLEQLVRDIARDEVMPRFLCTDSRRKADGTMLSEADLSAQAAFVARLPEIIDAPVLGEEMTREAQEKLWYGSPQGLWVVDPIDGTTNFVHGLPHFALSAAFVRNGRAELGVVFNPATDECFSAARGQGAFLNSQRLPLYRAAPKRLGEAIAGVEIKRLRSGRLVSRVNTIAPFGSLRCLGSSTLDWCYLAAGRFDIYVHGGQNLWDYAAGALIFEEAGGLFDTLEGDPFWSGQHVFQRSVIAAMDADLFERWRKWIRDNQ